YWTGWVEQDVGCPGLVHSGVRLLPTAPSVGAEAHPAPEMQRRIMPPHLRTRQVVRPAVDAPHAAFHLGIKLDPVSSVPPVAGNAVGGTCPRNSTILAAE